MPSSVSATSPTLLQQLTDRNAQAWEDMVRLYGPLIDSWVCRQGISPADACDVLQDVFANVSRSLDSFERKGSGAFRAWLWRITRNEVINWFRHRARQANAAGGTAAWKQLADVAASLPDAPDEHTDAAQLSALHQRALDLVRDEFEQRTWNIFQRAVMDNVSTKEVAEEFEITPNAVRQVRSRVLRRLRTILD